MLAGLVLNNIVIFLYKLEINNIGEKEMTMKKPSVFKSKEGLDHGHVRVRDSHDWSRDVDMILSQEGNIPGLPPRSEIVPVSC